MQRQILALVLNEGGRLISELIRLRVSKKTISYEPLSIPSNELPVNVDKATSIESGCVPCAIGHLGTCSGLLAESLRFGKKEGIGSDEVISRVNLCLDELNAMERVDLRPELIVSLSGKEKELADMSLTESRNIRHKLEGLSHIADLESVAADVQSSRQTIGKEWFKQKLANMPKEDKEKLVEKAVQKIEEG